MPRPLPPNWLDVDSAARAAIGVHIDQKGRTFQSGRFNGEGGVERGSAKTTLTKLVE